MDRKFLLKIGRYVVKKYPEIVNEISESKQHDLQKILPYLLMYIEFNGTKNLLCIDRKIFVTAMFNIYENQYKFKKTISNILSVAPPTISAIIKECTFRYKKDEDFYKNVNNFEIYLKNKENATIRSN
jgi:hypothetical protein